MGQNMCKLSRYFLQTTLFSSNYLHSLLCLQGIPIRTRDTAFVLTTLQYLSITRKRLFFSRRWVYEAKILWRICSKLFYTDSDS